jgi:hypothetical protein
MGSPQPDWAEATEVIDARVRRQSKLFVLATSPAINQSRGGAKRRLRSDMGPHCTRVGRAYTRGPLAM